MGADVYLKSRQKENEKKWKAQYDEAVKKLNRASDTAEEDEFRKEVENYSEKIDEGAYFRDSYNSTSLFWQLNLSWWRDVSDPMVKNGRLPIKHAKQLLKTLKEKELPEPALLNLENCKVDDGENSREVWHKYFSEKKKNLESMLEESIKLKEPLICSL